MVFILVFEFFDFECFIIVSRGLRFLGESTDGNVVYGVPVLLADLFSGVLGGRFYFNFALGCTDSFYFGIFGKFNLF